jgi:hypothetical protein
MADRSSFAFMILIICHPTFKKQQINGAPSWSIRSVHAVVTTFQYFDGPTTSTQCGQIASLKLSKRCVSCQVALLVLGFPHSASEDSEKSPPAVASPAIFEKTNMASSLASLGSVTTRLPSPPSNKNVFTQPQPRSSGRRPSAALLLDKYIQVGKSIGNIVDWLPLRRKFTINLDNSTQTTLSMDEVLKLKLIQNSLSNVSPSAANVLRNISPKPNTSFSPNVVYKINNFQHTYLQQPVLTTCCALYLLNHCTSR